MHKANPILLQLCYYEILFLIQLCVWFLFSILFPLNPVIFSCPIHEYRHVGKVLHMLGVFLSSFSLTPFSRPDVLWYSKSS